MTTEHTRGPWTVSDNHGKRYIEPVGDNEPVAIVCHGHTNSYSENANLIAAAPDLLQALEALLDMDISYQRGPKVQEAESAARLAVAKARGAQ